jgi:hypothetical protein
MRGSAAKMPALEHATLRFCTERAVAETLKQMVATDPKATKGARLHP